MMEGRERAPSGETASYYLRFITEPSVTPVSAPVQTMPLAEAGRLMQAAIVHGLRDPKWGLAGAPAEAENP